MVDRWKRGDTVMPAAYPAEGVLHVIRRQVHADRDRIDVRWARGHCGEPLNEGADALARLASRYRRGDHDLPFEEYRRRAAGIADGFGSEFRRVAEMTA